MLEQSPTDPVKELALRLEADLLKEYGPMLFGDSLRRALGYVSADAFRQAVSRGSIPVPVFALPKRRGKYALVKDVALWLARARYGRGSVPAGQHERLEVTP